MTWKASGATDLPLAADGREWDGDAAEDVIFQWAGWPADEDGRKVRRAFFAYDDSDPTLKKSYKLPFANVIDGELQVVPHALYAVASVLEGGRGGVDLPDEVIDAVRDKVEAYYRKMGKAAPW